MTETIHLLVEKYGLIAVFLGSLAEGESAAILAGFFAHQRIFVTWQAIAATFLGAFGGDTLFFLAGRHFSETRFVTGLRNWPGFDRAFRLVQEHPAAYVLLNRYAYGFRLVGGVAAGLSGIALPKFVFLNVVSSAIWATLFCTIGYVFGLGAEQMMGAALHKHERLLIALGIGLAVAALGWGVAHFSSRRAARREIS
ncbi:DedA family protein [Mesorhizobium sp. BAC0120]|uniref:DedA family protein n=1 Tax=Mesorhizobium sp. BAC0120 TaxID=3090670 RepID=UPI00298BDC7B|nr:DedA family protein [Mesorhizobium sp. BAC0120]MDW6023729.1 DedA family protein [Mesorhizobium sp. BAC0120]